MRTDISGSGAFRRHDHLLRLQISGPEVEAALLTHPEVAECGVVAAPDDDRGMVVKAYVVLRNPNVAGPEMSDTLQDHVKAEIAPYKYPRAIEFVAALPRTGTGKLQRFVLRQQAVLKKKFFFFKKKTRRATK